jgi:hypothetical protein
MRRDRAFFIEPQRAQRAQSKSKKRDRHRESSFFIEPQRAQRAQRKRKSKRKKRDRIQAEYNRVNTNHPDLEFNPEQVYRAKADEAILDQREAIDTGLARRRDTVCAGE